MAKTHHAITNALKHQLTTQHYEPSTTAHVVRKLLTVVVGFGTTIPNYPSIKALFGCFQCLDFRTKDLLLCVYIRCLTNKYTPSSYSRVQTNSESSSEYASAKTLLLK
jgi:hypothetical protein